MSSNNIQVAEKESITQTEFTKNSNAEVFHMEEVIIETKPVKMTKSVQFQEISPKSNNTKPNEDNKCSAHPEEILQFYCFNNTKVLCAECLVKGGYGGFEVSNLRKAAEKLRGKLNEYLAGMTGKLEDFSILAKDMQEQEDQIDKTTSNCKEQVKEKMDALRKAIDAKEKEMLEKITNAHEEKLKSIQEIINQCQSSREEITKIKDMIEHKLSQLSDLDVCNYYTAKAAAIRESLNGESFIQLQRARKAIERQQQQDQLTLSRFQEDCQRTLALITGFSIEGSKKKQEFLSSKESLESEIVCKLSPLNPPSYRIKEETEIDRVRKIRDSSAKSQRLPEKYSSAISPIYSTLTSPTISNRQTLERATSKKDLRDELNKDGSYKNLPMRYTPVMGNYAQKQAIKNSITPKTSPRDPILIQSNVSFREGLASNKLITSFLQPKSPGIASTVKTLNQTIDDQLGLCRTAPDFQASREDIFSPNRAKNDSFSLLGFENPFNNNKKTQKQVENIIVNENRLKQKLKSLNTQIFKS